MGDSPVSGTDHTTEPASRRTPMNDASPRPPGSVGDLRRDRAMRGSKQAAANRRNTLKSISGRYPRYRLPRQGWRRPGLRKADGVKGARPDATLSCNIPQINVLQCPKADPIQGILSAEPVLQSRSGDEICIAGSIRRPHSEVDPEIRIEPSEK